MNTPPPVVSFPYHVDVRIIRGLAFFVPFCESCKSESSGTADAGVVSRWLEVHDHLAHGAER